jgi:hypothetical protein
VEAGLLLCDIFDILALGSVCLTFVSENTFSAVGYEESTLLEIVLKKLFSTGYTESLVAKAVSMSISSYLDNDTHYTELLDALVSTLKTQESKEMALSCIENKTYSINASSSNFLNNAVDLYVTLKFSLQAYEEGISYFNANHKASSAEAKLHLLLTEHLYDEGLERYWIREYEQAVKQGVKPSKDLAQKYATLKAEFPD